MNNKTLKNTGRDGLTVRVPCLKTKAGRQLGAEQGNPQSCCLVFYTPGICGCPSGASEAVPPTPRFVLQLAAHFSPMPALIRDPPV